ncbi:monofunctional biosynthetic peptidoglycan transglycosylase [Massilia sp. PAMC28688]|uniref:monofunctional biosynthetic peptidoglycan transglycosylase n=1 Tax=Massilia sp. PAMC28688 TaxID=2861283 RepID=UPI001C6394EE|nr:monofunctional biosynthetic peptidoglycan transglycosylase [Massilia sp. PAMC28688]QYF91616.1 monofunctional biosynthetic peptidoglycan transglycosylase [Massilia sp. PAMC28688]
MSKAGKGSKSSRGRILTLLVVVPTLIFLLVQIYFLLMVCWYAQFNPRQTNMMREQLAVLQANNPRATLKYTWVPYERISIHLKRAVIASEDANFAEHDGVDWEALQKAYEKNNRRHKVVGGGSTITQQLAKNLFLSGSRSYLRKGQELIIAFMLETVLTKGRILELYLNVVEYGRGVFGAEAAARHYFRISAAQLGAAQSARLAVMLPNPRYYDKHRDTRYLNRRTNLILSRMGASDVP